MPKGQIKTKNKVFFSIVITVIVLLNLSVSLAIAAPSACRGVNEGTQQSAFCAEQTILDQILSFTEIPDSFGFPEIVLNGGVTERFNNAAGNQPNIDDLLAVQDTRNVGGFVVQVQASGNFIDSVNSSRQIDLTNCQPSENNQGSACFYTVTSTSSSYVIPGDPVETQQSYPGIIYQPTAQAHENIAAPVNAEGSSLAQGATYTSHGSNLGNSNVAVLMDGTLTTAEGRTGKFYQYVNYLLKIPGFPAVQPAPGNYAVILTFTLMESNG